MTCRPAAFIVLGLILLACQPATSRRAGSGVSDPLAAAAERIEMMEQDIRAGFLLSQVVDRDRRRVQGLLTDLRLSLALLGRDPGDLSLAGEISRQRDALGEEDFGPLDKRPFAALLQDLEAVLAGYSLSGSGDERLLFGEEFNDGPGRMRNVRVLGTADWTVPAGKGYAMVSGFQETARAAETWLLTPMLDLREAERPWLVVRQAWGYFTEPSDARIVVLTEPDPDQPVLEGEEIRPEEHPPFDRLSSWQWATTEALSLERWQDKPLMIALVYSSREGAAMTWEVDFLRVMGGGRITIGSGQE